MNNYERSDHYYDYDRNDLNRQNPFIKTLVVDDDGLLTLPSEFLEVNGWKEGDELEWSAMEDGSYRLRKLDQL